MDSYDVLEIQCTSASDFYHKYRKRLAGQRLLRNIRRVFIVALTIYFLVGFSSPTAQTSLVSDLTRRMNALQEVMDSEDEDVTNEITMLAEVIRFATDSRLIECEAMRYASLIHHASQLHEQDPIEIVALIVAESSFQNESINEKTGDFGLGQVNWKYWGQPNGLTPQDLIDPAINIVMTCEIFHHYGNNFDKYHRGDGIKSRAYSVNVKSILSLLKTHAKSLRAGMS